MGIDIWDMIWYNGYRIKINQIRRYVYGCYCIDREKLQWENVDKGGKMWIRMVDYPKIQYFYTLQIYTKNVYLYKISVYYV